VIHITGGTKDRRIATKRSPCYHQYVVRGKGEGGEKGKEILLPDHYTKEADFTTTTKGEKRTLPTRENSTLSSGKEERTRGKNVLREASKGEHTYISNRTDRGTKVPASTTPRREETGSGLGRNKKEGKEKKWKHVIACRGN